ncbi:MAG: hypothetical protein ABR543_15885 [Gemmatimonadaceae bacterium]
MRLRAIWLTAAVLLGITNLEAQQRDTTQRADSAARARADSVAAADSVRIVRELERIRGEPRGRLDSLPVLTTPSGQPGNPRLLPDISVVADLIADVSPDGSTQEDGTRLGVREIEVAFQANVDPYFRADVFLGVSDAEGIAVEQAFITTTALPWELEARLGRFLMPVGKQLTTHRHDLHTIEFPHVIQQFFGPEGLKGTGVYASRVFAPFGFYQELILTAVERFDAESKEELTTSEPINKNLDGLGYSARLRNYWDLSEAANLEISASGITGKRPQPLVTPGQDPETGDSFNAVAARQSVVGIDATFRWRPLQQGLYKSFILQAEVMRQLNQNPAGDVSNYAGPVEDITGAYVFARYQISRRLFLGTRFDHVDVASSGQDSFRAISGYLQFFPSEFSKLLAGYERVMPGGDFKDLNRLILQATVAIGPHKPHPF